MRTLLRASLAVFLFAAGLEAAAVLDTLRLKDGRVLSGQVVEETGSQVTLEVNGVQRRYSRDLIKSIRYGAAEAPAAAMPSPDGPPPADAAVPAPSTAIRSDGLEQDLATRYQVPLGEVRWVHRQGIADADLPLVFFVAAKAGVVPGRVVTLRLEGWSWTRIEEHFGIDAGRVAFVAGPWVPYPYFMFGGGWGWRHGWGWGHGRGWGWHRR